MEKINEFDLFKTYGEYFIQDFSRNVYDTLPDVYKTSKEDLDEFIRKTSEQLTQNVKTYKDINNETVFTKFIYECVHYAVDDNVSNPFSKSTWDYICQLESIHHDEINVISEYAASMYSDTLDNTINKKIVEDSKQTTQIIVRAIEDQTYHAESSDKIHKFNWGLLDNGLWLNSALLNAFDKTGAYDPDKPLNLYYSKLCFDFGRNYSYEHPMSAEEIEHCAGIFSVLAYNIPQEAIDDFEDVSKDLDFYDCLTNPSILKSWLNKWEEGFKDPKITIEAVDRLSKIISILNNLEDLCIALNNDATTPPVLVERIKCIKLSLSMCLVAYESIREVLFKSTVIMYAEKDLTNGNTDIYVNADILSKYYELEYTDEDLIKLGDFVANQSYTPSDGWTMDWVISRRDDLVAEYLSEGYNRSEQNDAISKMQAQSIIKDKLMKITLEYLNEKDIFTIPPEMVDKIDKISYNVIYGSSESLEDSVVSLLTDTSLDDLAIELTNRIKLSEDKENPIPTAILNSLSENIRNDIFVSS